MTEAATDRGDARVRRSMDKVLAATYELMTAGGLGGVSLDAVARRSGVAKTTIYRHWASRSALLLDACSRLGPRPETPDTGSLAGDLAALAASLASQLASARWPQVLPSILDAAEHDADIAQLQKGLHARFGAPYQTVVARAQAQGRLSPSVNPGDAAALVMGPLFHRRWFSREPLDAPFIAAVVAGALAALTATSG